MLTKLLLRVVDLLDPHGKYDHRSPEELRQASAKLAAENRLLKKQLLATMTETFLVERLADRAVNAAEVLLDAEGMDAARPLRAQMNNVGIHLGRRKERTRCRIRVMARHFKLPLPQRYFSD